MNDTERRENATSAALMHYLQDAPGDGRDITDDAIVCLIRDLAILADRWYGLDGAEALERAGETWRAQRDADAGERARHELAERYAAATGERVSTISDRLIVSVIR